MSKNSLFRKTPFNGYNREDVDGYIIDQDEKIAELRQALDRKASELADIKKESDRLKQDVDNREGIMTVLDEMNVNEMNVKSEKIAALEASINGLRAELSEKDARIRALEEEVDRLRSESEELLKAAKIKSDYMVKNAEFYAYSTKEKLLSARKTVDAAMADIDKTILASREDEER